MKILMIHNFYGSSAPSGENQVFVAERDLLLKNGHAVEVLSRHSDEIRSQGSIGLVRGALATPWNPWSAREVIRLVARFQPDIVHVHNTFPLISPSIFQAVGNSAARVLTLHNYRLFCPAAIPMRQGKVCTECLDRKNVWSSLKYGCYRDSRLATIPLALNVALHRWVGTWEKEVDAFIALTEFQRDVMVAAGLPKAKVHEKPNFFPGSPKPVPWNQRGNYAVFAGRLAPEKGVETLVRAWKSWGNDAPELRIVGNGILKTILEELGKGANISFLGQLSAEWAQTQISEAKMLILPSEWFEGFPMVVREAFAFGTPAAVSAIGPLPSIVKEGETGVCFEPGNPESLLGKVRKAWVQPDILKGYSEKARKTFEGLYTEEVNYRKLLEIYDQAKELKLRNKNS